MVQIIRNQKSITKMINRIKNKTLIKDRCVQRLNEQFGFSPVEAVQILS